MNLTLRIWRQRTASEPGAFQTYQVKDISPNQSFLEMLDVLNEELLQRGDAPVAFDSDCREGICGTCGFVVNGRAHGPRVATTICQLHMRLFRDGDTITLEPFRAAAFPVIRDLVVDRSSFDRIIQAGGFISVSAGSAPEANSLPIPKEAAERSMDAAACIGCGACVAACPNAAAMLFAGAKLSHLGLLPQGRPERMERAAKVVHAMDREGFGYCTNAQECIQVCPKQIPFDVIVRMNRDFFKSALVGP